MATLTRRTDQPYMSLRDAMDQLFADAFAPLGGTARSGQDSLPMNVYESNDDYYLQMLAPGIDPDAAEITAANGVLSIFLRQQLQTGDNWRPVWQEFTPTEFRRQLRLPVDFDASKIEANYQNGVLTITVPKAEHTRPKTIKVQAGK